MLKILRRVYRLFPSRTKNEKKNNLSGGGRDGTEERRVRLTSRVVPCAPFKQNRWTSTFVRRKSFLGTVTPAATSLRFSRKKKKN